MDAEHSYRYWGDEEPELENETEKIEDDVDEEVSLAGAEYMMDTAETSQAVPQKPRIGLGLASMILGIVTFMFFWMPLIPFTTGVLAVIFGIIALAKKCRKSFALTGLITGGASLLLMILLIVGFTQVDWGDTFSIGSPDDGFSFHYEYGTDDVFPELNPGGGINLDIEDFV